MRTMTTPMALTSTMTMAIGRGGEAMTPFYGKFHVDGENGDGYDDDYDDDSRPGLRAPKQKALRQIMVAFKPFGARQA